MNRTEIINMVMRLTKTARTIKGKKKIIEGFTKKTDNFRGDSSLLAQVKKLYNYFMDPYTSNSKKALIGAGLLYFILPFDVVNDFLPGLGYLDDAVAIAYVFSLIEKELGKYDEKGIIDR